MAALLVVAPLVPNGAPNWLFGVLAAASASLLAATVLLASDRAPPRSVAIWLLGGVASWVGFQALTLPCDWVAPLSLNATRIQIESAAIVGQATDRCTISYAPAETHRVFLQDLACLCLLLTAHRLGSRDCGKRIGAILALSTGAMVLTVALHWLTNTSAVFGLYTPREARPTVMAPLLNGNHLAGFLGFGAPFLVWIVLARRTLAIRIAAAVTLVGSGVIIGATGSRSGAASFAASVLAAVLWRAMEEGGSLSIAAKLKRAALPFAVALTGTLLTLLFTLRTENDTFIKPASIKRALVFAFNAPMVGFGRGAFSAAYVQVFGSSLRTVHAENIVADVVAQLGLPIATLLALTLLLGCGARITQLRGAQSAALLALLGLALHDLGDFALQMPSVAFAAAAALGIVLARPAVIPDDPPRFGSAATLPPLALASLSLGLAAAWAPDMGGRTVQRYLDVLSASRSRDPAEFQKTLRAAVHDYPAEPAFPLIAAAEAIDRGSPKAPVWLNRAMALAPGWPGPHIEAARWLMGHGRESQAALELRSAAELDLATGAGGTCELTQRWRSAELILAAAPNEPARGAFLNLAVRCLAPDDPLQVVVDAEAGLHGDRDAILRHAGRLMLRGSHAEAERLLRGAHSHHPNREILVKLCETLIASGRPNEAIALAAKAGSLDRVAVLQIRARAFAAWGDATQMRVAIDELQNEHYTSAFEGADALTLLGELEETLGERERALSAFERALWLRKTPELTWRYARLAESAGDLMRARHAYQELCDGPPPNASACEHLPKLPVKIIEQLRGPRAHLMGAGEP